MEKQQPKAIVIGAGIAGMATAIRLQVQGYEVEVYEQAASPGGKLGFFSAKGYQFDTGPSLFTQPSLIEELFALAGEPIQDHFSYHRVPVSCNYFYEDGSRITAHADHAAFAREVNTVTGEPEQHLLQYLQNADKLYKSVAAVFLDHSLHEPKTWLGVNWPAAFRSVRLKHLMGSMHDVNQKSFRDPRLVQLFDRYATYNGSNPYKAPGMLSMIPHLEHNEGTFYPKGGMISIVHALYELALKKGVNFHFNSKVSSIIHSQQQVRGIRVGDKNISANVVVSNVDVYFTYLHLLNDLNKAKKILKQERSSSALIFYWGIAKSFPQLDLHNIFFTHNYVNEFNHLFKYRKPYSDPTVYVNITSKCEPGFQAPEGKENWFVMVNVPANTGQDWQKLRTVYRQAVLEKLSRILGEDLASLIETEDVLDPVLIEQRTGSYQGSLYGTSSNGRFSAFLRHPNFSRTMKGLYFVGGSVHPGGGIPLCLRSARIASERISKKETKHSLH